MCVVSTPSIPNDPNAQQKPLPILRNTMLDGLLGNIAAIRNGRNSLRIPLNPLGIPVGGSFPGGGSPGSGNGGGSSTGGSTGGSTTIGGGGFCVTVDSLVLMADGTEVPAADLQVGDLVFTRHESTFEFGGHPITNIEFAFEPTYSLIGHPNATAGHRFALPAWLARRLPERFRWFRMGWLGRPAGLDLVAKLTVANAHTYMARHPRSSHRPLSHNMKPTVA